MKMKITENCWIDILWPIKSELIEDNALNNNSLVFKFIYKNLSILFTGDIEEIAEKQIIEKYKNTDRLKANILKVAHHGSKSSTIQSFIDLVQPQIALIGVGKNNNFGHPNDGVLQRLNNKNVNVYRTDEKGEILIYLKNNNINIKSIVRDNQ